MTASTTTAAPAEHGDGGPAFPGPEMINSVSREVTAYASQGMSLRDYFAAAALQGFCASREDERISTNDLCALVYDLADSMLIERAK
jgi:hypothetical protein